MRYCLLCEKKGHTTSECWSTHGFNTDRAREIGRLVALKQDPVCTPSDYEYWMRHGIPEGTVSFVRSFINEQLLAQVRAGADVEHVLLPVKPPIRIIALMAGSYGGAIVEAGRWNELYAQIVEECKSLQSEKNHD